MERTIPSRVAAPPGLAQRSDRRRRRRTAVGDHCQQRADGQPDPEHLVGEDAEACSAEDCVDAQWRGGDRPPGEEESPIAERNEEADAEAGIGESVEEAVRCAGEKGDEEEAGRRSCRVSTAASQTERHDPGNQSRKCQRVREAPVTERMRVGNAEEQADEVEIGKRGNCRQRDARRLRCASVAVRRLTSRRRRKRG